MPRLFISLILFFTAAVIGLFYLGPEWRTFRILRQRLENLTATSVELDVLVQNRDELISKINTIPQTDLSRIEKAVPQGPHGAEFLVLLEGLAVRHGLVLKRVDLAGIEKAREAAQNQPRPSGLLAETATASGDIKELPANLNVAGSYEKLKAFLEDLELNLRLIDIEELSFTAPSKADIFDFSLKLKTYYQ